MTKTTREKTKETVTYLAQLGMKPRKIFTVVKMKTTREKKYVVRFKRVVEDTDLAVKIRLSNQRNLAKKVGVSGGYISGIIRGKYAISEEMYLKIKQNL